MDTLGDRFNIGETIADIISSWFKQGGEISCGNFCPIVFEELVKNQQNHNALYLLLELCQTILQQTCKIP